MLNTPEVQNTEQVKHNIGSGFLDTLEITLHMLYTTVMEHGELHIVPLVETRSNHPSAHLGPETLETLSTMMRNVGAGKVSWIDIKHGKITIFTPFGIPFGIREGQAVIDNKMFSVYFTSRK